MQRHRCNGYGLLAFLLRCRQFDLHTVHTVDTVDEQDQDEDERDLGPVSTQLAHVASNTNLHAILQFCYQRVLRDEVEELALPGIRKRHDEQHEHAHLRHEQEKHLRRAINVSTCSNHHKTRGVEESQDRSVDE